MSARGTREIEAAKRHYKALVKKYGTNAEQLRRTTKKKGKLKTSAGAKVTDRKQALAIGMSEKKRAEAGK